MGKLEWRFVVYLGLRKTVKEGSGNRASLSMVSLRGEPGGRAPLLETLKDA
jgi:hypothetical protein